MHLEVTVPRSLALVILVAGFLLACTPVPDVAPSPTPTDTPPPTVTETPAPVTDTSAAASLPQLVIATVPGNIPAYHRDAWRHWIDEDGDCLNTRHEVLVDESLSPVMFTRSSRCSVATGQWLAPFTGTIVTSASELDVHHMVPIANAHRSGGWEWNARRKRAYANDLSYEGHLIAVTASANRSKGSRGPEEWKPPDTGYWCAYAKDWVTIKATWDLTVTISEWEALQGMLDTCAEPFDVLIVVGDSPSDSLL